MSGVRRIVPVSWAARLVTAVALVAALCCAASAQVPAESAPPARNALPQPAAEATPPDPSLGPTGQVKVVEVRIEGRDAIPMQKINAAVHTRAGRTFDRTQVEDDVRSLVRTRLFVSVNTRYQTVPDGVVVIFQLVERPTLRFVRYIGNTVRTKNLEKETGLKVGDAVDPYAIEEARRKIEEYYHTHGFSKATVKTIDGGKTGDRGATFLINEGYKQKIWNITFEGNRDITDARLKTQIQSSRPIFFVFKGEVDREKIDEDVNRLISYYRSLGYFAARVGRELEFNEQQSWLTLRFVVDEGPRYRVRSVAVVGNKRFGTADLTKDIKLTGGEYFNQSVLSKDQQKIQDTYGKIGYIFCNVQAEPRFQDEPGTLDLVYNIAEGDRYRVGKIDVQIQGEDSHTKRAVVLSRLSLHPGDIVDVTKLRDSERRLKASGLFLNDPAKGAVPKIVFERPDLDKVDDAENIAERPNKGIRGQSPDDVVVPGDRWIGVEVDARQPPNDPATARPAAAPASNAPPGPVFVPPFSRDAVPPSAVPGANDPRVLPPGVGRTAPVQLGQQPLGRTSPDSTIRGLMPGPSVVRAQSPAPGQYNTWQNPPQAGPRFAAQPVAYNQVVQPQTAPLTNPGDPFTTPATLPPAGTLPPPGALPPPTAAVYAQPSAPGQAIGPAGDGSAVFGPPAQQEVQNPYPDPGAVYPPGGVPFIQPGEGELPTVPLAIQVQEAQTGRLMFGVGINSDAGLLGQIVIEERNFDITRFPQSWEDVGSLNMFRGGGQNFRIEAVPGTQVQRYLFDFTDPYLFYTPVSLNVSGFYFTRQYRDWSEERLGGKVGLGYQFSPDLTGMVSVGAQRVNIFNPVIPAPPDLTDAVGSHDLYSTKVSLAHDTRDSSFLATQGHRVELALEHVFGSYDFNRATIDARQHFLIHERPDGSGRQVLTLSSTLGIEDRDTPIFERFYAGGYSTLRGFDFREASPHEMGVAVGGTFEFLNSVEYMFPLTADDMLRGVVFVDYGTVEKDVAIRSKNFRISPGAGLRITVPALGPAPIAFDFSAPIHRAEDDDTQIFTFFVGFSR